MELTKDSVEYHADASLRRRCARPVRRRTEGRVSAVTTTTTPGQATFANVLRSEWTKIISVRSTVWTVIAMVVTTIGFGVLICWATEFNWDKTDASQRALFDPTSTSLTGLAFGQLAVAVLGVMVISTEYSTGGIRTSLTAVPKRFRLLGAKAWSSRRWPSSWERSPVSSRSSSARRCSPRSGSTPRSASRRCCGRSSAAVSTWQRARCSGSRRSAAAPHGGCDHPRRRCAAGRPALHPAPPGLLGRRGGALLHQQRRAADHLRHPAAQHAQPVGRLPRLLRLVAGHSGCGSVAAAASGRLTSGSSRRAAPGGRRTPGREPAAQ